MQGEVLQSWAEAAQTACSHLPDAQLSPAAELQARSEGAAMLDEAVHVYQQVGNRSFSKAACQEN